jgi:effector-binding domain-containing protein
MTAYLMLAVLVTLVASAAFAQPAATQPAGDAKPAYHLSEPIYKELKAIKPYVYTSAKTTIPKIKETVQKSLDPLFAKHGSLVNGPLIFVYHGITQDHSKQFEMEMGFPAREEPKDLAGFKSRPLAPFKCVSVYYTGGLANIGKAYEAVIPALFKMGYKPTDENREVYLFWEDNESPNNVTEIQIGVIQ